MNLNEGDCASVYPMPKMELMITIATASMPLLILHNAPPKACSFRRFQKNAPSIIPAQVKDCKRSTSARSTWSILRIPQARQAGQFPDPRGDLRPSGSAALRGELSQPLSKRRVVRSLALVAWGRMIHPYQSAGVSLTLPVALRHFVHRQSLRRRLQTFFPSRSLSAALSSIDSASSRFKRRFSSSRALRRRASGTSSPPTSISTCKVSRLRSRGAGTPLRSSPLPRAPATPLCGARMPFAQA